MHRLSNFRLDLKFSQLNMESAFFWAATLCGPEKFI
jgi:hypothetical protein